MIELGGMKKIKKFILLLICGTIFCPTDREPRIGICDESDQWHIRDLEDRLAYTQKSCAQTLELRGFMKDPEILPMYKLLTGTQVKFKGEFDHKESIYEYVEFLCSAKIFLHRCAGIYRSARAKGYYTATIPTLDRLLMSNVRAYKDYTLFTYQDKVTFYASLRKMMYGLDELTSSLQLNTGYTLHSHHTSYERVLNLMRTRPLLADKADTRFQSCITDILNAQNLLEEAKALSQLGGEIFGQLIMRRPTLPQGIKDDLSNIWQNADTPLKAKIAEHQASPNFRTMSALADQMKDFVVSLNTILDRIDQAEYVPPQYWPAQPPEMCELPIPRVSAAEIQEEKASKAGQESLKRAQQAQIHESFRRQEAEYQLAKKAEAEEAERAARAARVQRMSQQQLPARPARRAGEKSAQAREHKSFQDQQQREAALHQERVELLRWENEHQYMGYNSLQSNLIPEPNFA